MGVAFRDAAKARHDLAWGAIAALQAFMLDEGSLKRVQLLALRKALDGGDLGAVVHDSER
jgi:hypothetical protein